MNTREFKNRNTYGGLVTINLDHILSIESAEGSATHTKIKFINGETIEVEGSYADIKKKIGDTNKGAFD